MVPPLVELARRCQRTPRNGVPEILSVLIGRGLAHRLDDNRLCAIPTPDAKPEPAET
jgi:hypothetical protein